MTEEEIIKLLNDLKEVLRDKKVRDLLVLNDALCEVLEEKGYPIRWK